MLGSLKPIKIKGDNMQSPLNERDTEFFDEVYALIKSKYPEMEDKFGIWKVHNHFEIKDDEVFHETSNKENKESTLKIIQKKNLPENAFVSSWKLTNKGPIAATWCCDDTPLI
jgi:hypothetical protein